MAIEKLHQSPLLVHQRTGELDVPEAPIAICHEYSPLIIMSQEGREILVDLDSVNELCKALKQVKAAAQQYQDKEARNG
ncbi:MAG: hypothetical protein Q7Q73_09205 [Verrucomicrobiota bacterium JB024]|nr:hypothetical protein [Verrucomicrobiota bacterium JB024]